MAEESLLSRLAAPFSPATVSWRLGPTNADKTRGMALAYIDARDVQDRLNDVCGTDWQVRFPWAIPGKMTCEIGIRIDGEWIWRGDGAGDTDVEAEKGAFSDAFKRAAVRWNIGRYLYDVDAPWIALEKRGNLPFIPDGELAKLRDLLGRGQRPKDVLRTSDTSPGPSSTGETLSQKRDRIMKALHSASDKLLPDQILKINAADLQAIKEGGPNTYDRIIAYATERTQELAEEKLTQPIGGSTLAQKLREGLVA